MKNRDGIFIGKERERGSEGEFKVIALELLIHWSRWMDGWRENCREASGGMISRPSSSPRKCQFCVLSFVNIQFHRLERRSCPPVHPQTFALGVEFLGFLSPLFSS
jgi:hypothetical protein